MAEQVRRRDAKHGVAGRYHDTGGRRHRNAANAQLLGCFIPFHACIDNAIHAAAEPRLREDCARIMRLQGWPEPVRDGEGNSTSNVMGSPVSG